MKVKSSTLKIWKENQPVYCMNVEDNHNFLIKHLNKKLVVKNCAGWSIKEFLEQGMNGVRGRIDSSPPKHLTSAMYQIINIMGVFSNEWMGAQAFNNFDTHLAAFIKKDNLSEPEIEQAVQCYLWNINVPSRWAGQAPFTNITFDLKVPNSLKEIHPIIGKKKMCFTYGDLQPEIDKFNKIFFKVMEKGDALGNIFQYPIPNICCTKEFFENLDPEVEEGIYKIASKYGIPYFSNYCGNTDQSQDDILAMCSVHPSTLIEVELEEDIVEDENGNFYTIEEAKKLRLI
jgi:ribonucleoside-triphosphate reductase